MRRRFALAYTYTAPTTGPGQRVSPGDPFVVWWFRPYRARGFWLGGGPGRCPSLASFRAVGAKPSPALTHSFAAPGSRVSDSPIPAAISRCRGVNTRAPASAEPPVRLRGSARRAEGAHLISFHDREPGGKERRGGLSASALLFALADKSVGAPPEVRCAPAESLRQIPLAPERPGAYTLPHRPERMNTLGDKTMESGPNARDSGATGAPHGDKPRDRRPAAAIHPRDTTNSLCFRLRPYERP